MGEQIAPRAKTSRWSTYLWMLKVPLFLLPIGWAFYLTLIFFEKLTGPNPRAADAIGFATFTTYIVLLCMPIQWTPSRWRRDVRLRRMVTLACALPGLAFLWATDGLHASMATFAGLGVFPVILLALRWWWNDDETSWPYQLCLIALAALGVVLVCRSL